MTAVLLDAIGCVEKYRCARDYRGRRLFDEVRQWFLAQETDWPYSFECICEVLNLDSDAVRRRLRLASEQQHLLVPRRVHTPRHGSPTGI